MSNQIKPISWDDQQTFLLVLEEGSFSGASRRLGISHATVRARLEALEAALGTVLFTRSVNGLTPTDTALALAGAARTMAMASDLFVREASSRPGEAAGTVRISVSEFMGVEVLPPMLAQLRLLHPAIHVELSLSNAPADVLGQEVDIAIRTMTPQQDALVARKVASIPLGIFASLDYLDRKGTPTTLADLARHDIIGPDRSRADLALAERLGPGITRDRLVLRTDSHPTHLAAARAGIGIAVTQVPVGQGDPRLRRVLPDFVVAHLPIWLVTHENLRNAPRVRVTLDHLAATIAAFADQPRVNIG